MLSVYYIGALGMISGYNAEITVLTITTMMSLVNSWLQRLMKVLNFCNALCKHMENNAKT